MVCPSCGKKVGAKYVKEGFRLWLERMKKDPETYAQIMASFLMGKWNKTKKQEMLSALGAD